MSPPTAGGPELRRCGCRDRELAQRVAELGNTPGVFICAGCVLWAARRAGPLYALSQVRSPGRRPVRPWRHRRRSTGGGPT
jgi:hypothetical protein